MSENTNTSEVELVSGTVESIHNDIPADFLYTLGKSLIEDHKEMIHENESDIIAEESIVEEPLVEEVQVVVEEPVVIVEEPVVEEVTLVFEEPVVIVEEPVVEEVQVVVEEPLVEELSVVVEEPLVEELTPTVEINVKCGCFSVGTSFLYKRHG